MTTYQQTVLIPVPKQNLRDAKNFGCRYGYRGREYRNENNREVNSILAFFD